MKSKVKLTINFEVEDPEDKYSDNLENLRDMIVTPIRDALLSRKNFANSGIHMTGLSIRTNIDELVSRNDVT